jgi:hypothetical protein
MKTIKTAFLLSMIGLGGFSWSVAAATTTISGNGLSSLLYLNSYSTGSASFVPAAGATPAYAQLYTSDASDADGADAPAVDAAGTFGTLRQVSMSFSLLPESVLNGNLPYGELWVVLPDSSLGGIIGFGGTALNDSTQMHVIYTSGPTYFGDTLGSILNDTYEGVAYGDMEVVYAGVEIGLGGSGAETADISSITVTTPDAASTLSLLGVGFGVLAGLRRRLNRA